MSIVHENEQKCNRGTMSTSDIDLALVPHWDREFEQARSEAIKAGRKRQEKKRRERHFQQLAHNAYLLSMGAMLMMTVYAIVQRDATSLVFALTTMLLLTLTRLVLA